MKTFTAFQDVQDQLDEGVIRSGTVATFAARSTTASKKAERAFRKGLSVLDDATAREDIIARLDRIDAVLKELLRGHLHQRLEARNHVALNTLGHLFDDKRKPRR